MYAALMTGVANHLCACFDYEPKQVRYGGTDDFWNKFNMEKVVSPGLVYGCSQINFPKGFSAHTSEYIGKSNFSETEVLRVRPVLFTVTLSLGMIADNENDHFHQIHRYVEMGVFHARLKYRVKIPEANIIEEWESTIGDFQELTPAPGGRDSNTYDAEGRMYKLEGSFTLHSQFFMTDKQKLVRCIYINPEDEDISLRYKVGKDSQGNKYPHTSDY